mgnify:CR=1 FL=1
MDRRIFTKLSLGVTSLASVGGLASGLVSAKPKKMKKVFIHQVYFWLHNPDNVGDRNKMLEGLALLSNCKTIKAYHIGKPAGTSREVIDGSYTYSWMTTFDNEDDQQAYQVDPIHDRFRNEYHHLWSKVLVYDSIDV